MKDHSGDDSVSRIEANYRADLSGLAPCLLPAVLRLDAGPRYSLVGLLASLARCAAGESSYELGLIHGHIFAIMQRNELSQDEVDVLWAFVREHTL